MVSLDSVSIPLRDGARSCLRKPEFTIIAATILGLGIAANTLVFSIVDALLLRPLAYPNSEQLVRVGEVNARGQGADLRSSSYPVLAAIEQENFAFESVAGYRELDLNIVVNGQPRQVSGAIVASDFFRVLGVSAERGRTFIGASNKQTVVLSSGLSRQLFGREADAVGKAIIVEEVPYLIGGTMPSSFAYPTECDLWVPLDRSIPDHAADSTSYGTRRWSIVARLRQGAGLKEARSQMSIIGDRIAKAFPESNRGWTIGVISLREAILGDAGPAALLLFGAVILLLLISCANVGSLSLIHSMGRRQEMAIRTALGSSTSRIVLQVLSQNVLIAMIGWGIGATASLLTIKSAVALAPADLPFASDIRVDIRAMGFAGLLSLSAGVLCGLIPAIGLIKSDLNPTLKGAGRSHRERAAFRRVLVAGEVAVSFVLLCGAILLTKSLVRLKNVDPGFRTDSAVIFRISRPFFPNRSPDELFSLWSGFQDRLLKDVRNVSGVEDVAASMALPLEGDRWRTYVNFERPVDPSDVPVANERVVSLGYFEVMKIPLLRGRYFSEVDTRSGAKVAMINRAFADRYFPNENPIGKSVEVKAFGIGKAEIVGIVRNVRNSLDKQPNPELYHCYSQVAVPVINVIVRTRLDRSGLEQDMRRIVFSLDARQPISSLGTFDQDIAVAVGYPKFRTALMVTFAGLAILLVIVGTYCLIDYHVKTKIADLGIRMALGAGRGRIFVVIIREAVIITAEGVGLGIPIALVASQMLRKAVYGVGITDTFSYSAATVLVCTIIFLGALVPSLKATRIDPATVLRNS